MSPSTSPTSTVSLDQALADLPAKLRVHELAKRAGVSSKEIIAGLAAAGVPVSSAASSVGSADATVVLTALLDPAASNAPEADVPIITEVAPEPDAGVVAAPLFLPPEAKPARRKRTPKAVVESQITLDTDPGASAEPVGPDDSPAPDNGETDVGAAGTTRSGRRRRGRAGAKDVAPTVAVPTTATPDVDSSVVPEVTAEAGELGSGPDDEESDQAPRGRRRRGRRGRGRVGDDRNDQDQEAESDQNLADVSATDDRAGGQATEGGADQADEAAGEEDAEGGTRRRRRRRRRSGSAEGSTEETGQEDDPDNTVVHVRESRATGGGTQTAAGAAAEVQGVRGSTRLEAKRQRRRDTRGSRNRPQILTESEFLARREAVDRVMAVRQRGDLAQVALLEDGVLVEHFVSRAGSESLMGNIYLGRVQNVLPSMEAAFVDIGKGRNAVLYAGEVNWDAAGLAGKARRIETALSPGDTVLVQVSKDPVGQKGARLTTQLSLPGRFLVYVPGGGATGISRKLPDTERKRLKSILDRIVPEDAGVIIRTAAEGVNEEELARDVDRLKSQWEEISRQAGKKSNAPLQLSTEPNTLIKVIRDLFNSDISRLVLDGDQAYEPVAAYINAVAPELADRVSRYDGPNDVFAAYRIDEQIAKALERKVYLPSGGSLVIDRTEAMTVVDVNTGKYTGSGGNLEETVTKNNLEAAEEVVRQLRLRDIGGIIVVDFIDMVLESNRELVMRRLTECLGRDRTRHQVAEVTSLGLVQMTRKKMGTGLVEAFSEPCPHCQGRGIILHDVPVQDRSGNQDFADDDKRSARGRRGKNRQEPATPDREPIVKIVPATVRPPDPRGPRPPSRAGDDHLHGDGEVAFEDSSDTSRFDTDPIFEPAAPIFEPAAEVPGVDDQDDAAFNAPKSQDASDAVSAVLAALDAQTAVRPAEPGAGAGAGTAEPAAPAGRRRGRRAAARPAGAPTAVGSPAIVEIPVPDAVSDEMTAAPAVDQTAESLMEVIAQTTPLLDPIEDAEPVRRGRAPRRRSSRASTAPDPGGDAPTGPVPAGPAQANGAPDSNGAADSNGGADSDGVAQASAAVQVNGADRPELSPAATPKAAAPRRRRAASRPAGPAGAPAPITQN